MRVRVYEVLYRAVDAGVEYGWHRAHKHTDKPDAETIKDQILNAVMSDIGEYFEFDEPAVDDRVPHHKCPLGTRKALTEIRAGRLPAEKVGRVYFIRREDLNAYFSRHRVKPTRKSEPVDEFEEAVRKAARRTRQ